MAGPEDSLSAANTYPLTDLTASLLGYDKDGGNEGIEQLSGGSYGVLSWNDEDMINEYLSSSDKFPHVITLEKVIISRLLHRHLYSFLFNCITVYTFLFADACDRTRFLPTDKFQLSRRVSHAGSNIYTH